MSPSEPKKPRGRAHEWTEDELDRLCEFSEADKEAVAEQARILLPTGFETLLDAERTAE